MVKGTYAYLLQQYGLASAYNTGSLTGTSPVNGNTYNLVLSPLFFMRGGWIDPSDTNKFNYAGQNGHYWSSLAAPYNKDTFSYLLLFHTSVYPSASGNWLNGPYQYYGQSLRCLISTP